MLAAWRNAGTDHRLLVRTVCSDVALWGADLAALPGFTDSVTEHLTAADRDGIAVALDTHLAAVSAA